MEPIKNPPIREALIDIRVSVPDDFQIEDFKSHLESLRDEFPVVETIQQGGIEVQIGDEGPMSTNVENSLIGFRCISADKKEILQFRSTGFTFSRLEPYTRWDDLKEKALRFFDLYVGICKPELITRVAVRYINCISIPKTFSDFGEFFTCPVAVPKELPQGLGNFLVRWTSVEPESDINCIFTQALEGITDKDAKIILDIDAFILASIEPDNRDYLQVLESLRDFKNKAFFSSITDELKMRLDS